MRGAALALLLAGCSGAKPVDPAIRAREPPAWLDRSPNLVLSVDLDRARAAEVILPLAERCLPPKPRERGTPAALLRAMPCAAELVRAERLDAWIDWEEADEPPAPHSVLVAARAAGALAGCLAREAPGLPIAPGVVEHVRTAQIWPRAYVLGGDTVLLPYGPAVAATRAALARGTAPPIAHPLPPDVVAQGVVGGSPLWALRGRSEERADPFDPVLSVAFTARFSPRALTVDVLGDFERRGDVDVAARGLTELRAQLERTGATTSALRPSPHQLSLTVVVASERLGAVCR